MKTHFCHIMEWYDGNDAEYVWKSFCWLEYYEKWSNRFGDVDCKKCLKKAKIMINAPFKNFNLTDND